MLSGRLGYRFEDADLLGRALAHRSWCAETPGTVSNERLEFLGDAVLGLAVADHIFRTYRDLPEGELSKVRAAVVNSVVLAEVASGLEVGPALLLGKGEDQAGGREKPSILADVMEALIAAVYLDGGWPEAYRLVVGLLGDRIAEGQSFADDLGADSLALIELVEALEEELAERTVGFRIEDEDLEDLKTVRDAVDYVYARVNRS